MKKILIILSVVIGIGALITLNIAFTKDRAKPVAADALETIRLVGETMYDTIVVSGQVHPAGREAIMADIVLGEIVHFYVEEGEYVEEGDPLFRYENTDLEQQKQQLELSERRFHLQQSELNRQINNAENRLSDAKKDVADAKKEVDQAKKDLEKAKKDELLSEEMYQQMLEQREEQLRYNEAMVKQVEEEIASLKVQAEMMQLEEEEMKIQMDRLEKMEKDLIITSPINGIVREINSALDYLNSLQPEPVLYVEEDAPLLVKGTISEYESVQMREGLEVIIKPKVLLDQEWQGVIKSIDMTPVQIGMDMGNSSNITNYPFTIEVTEEKDGLHHGYNVHVEILLDGKENVIIVPFDAILQDIGGEYVYILEENKLIRRDISTGMLNENGKEVISGLSIGEELILYPLSNWSDGMEVSRNDSAE